MTPSQELSMSSAARVAGVSISTVRRWVDSGLIEHTTNHQGWRVVTKASLMAYLSQQSHDDRRTVLGATVKASYKGVMNNPNDSLSIALEALQRERNINDELRNQIRSLESELVKLTLEIKALLTGKTGTGLMRWVQNLKK